MSSYKKQAEKRNLNFDLSEEEFKNITKQNCHYCGVLPTQIASDGKKSEFSRYIYNGIDRKDNTLGYSITNCVPCCGVCNRMKMALDYEQFNFQIRKIYDNICKNNL